MKKALLKRLIDTGKETLGVFSYYNGENIISFTSLELPWKDNQQDISCIPKGVYNIITTYSPKYKRNMWLVRDVEGRSGVRIHSANYFYDIEGCIALGAEFKDLNQDNELDITESRKSVKQAETDLGEAFTLTII